MKQTFPSWTEYDAWIVENYDKFSVYGIDEGAGGGITIEYCPRADFAAIRATCPPPERA